MKMIMITYNEAMDDEVTELLDQNGMSGHTKFKGVFGKGKTSGTHEGNDTWPGLNNVVYVAADDDTAKKLMQDIRILREHLKQEGIKAFVLPIEDVTI